MRDLPEHAPGGCCAAGAAGSAAALGRGDGTDRWSREATGGARVVDLMVPSIHCPACMATIEGGLGETAGVSSARVNLTMRRVQVHFDPGTIALPAILDRLDALGFEAKPYDAAAMADLDRDRKGRDLLARLGVAGFAAMNVMLLSVAVWSGAEGATRDLLHWVSAGIALPAIAFSGQPFFRSARAALAARRLNMDVPISLAVILAAGTSLYETATSGQHAYFDAGVSLLFFLLLGRYLDHRTRAAARSAAAEVTALAARSATVVLPDGSRRAVAADALCAGDVVEVAAGERIPADGVVLTGESDLDRSLVTGETAPDSVCPGAEVHAGMMNLSGLLTVRARATGEGTLLAEIARLVEAAEHGKSRFDRWADRAARIYAPGVHLIALVAFVGWVAGTGDWHRAVTIASAVLIITCPCALGLAVPAVHAVAGGRLFRNGVLIKDGAALERLSEIRRVAFDKTGTLTDGSPRLADAPSDDHPAWPVAASLARASRHPLAKVIAAEAEARGIPPAPLEGVTEHPGRGVEARHEGRTVRLGSASFTGADPLDRTAVHLAPGDGTVLAYSFSECVREDAPAVCEALRSKGFEVCVLSGDATGPVAAISAAIGISDVRAGLSPLDKLKTLEKFEESGERTLMIGDGINDAPALAAAHVSMSPVSAADVSRATADFVFTGTRLAPALFAIRTAQTARTRALQNFALAAIYNAVAIPLALAGLVTPLVAALAMSGSSIVVTLNAMRRW